MYLANKTNTKRLCCVTVLTKPDKFHSPYRLIPIRKGMVLWWCCTRWKNILCESQTKDPNSFSIWAENVRTKPKAMVRLRTTKKNISTKWRTRERIQIQDEALFQSPFPAEEKVWKNTSTIPNHRMLQLTWVDFPVSQLNFIILETRNGKSFSWIREILIFVQCCSWGNMLKTRECTTLIGRKMTKVDTRRNLEKRTLMTSRVESINRKPQEDHWRPQKEGCEAICRCQKCKTTSLRCDEPYNVEARLCSEEQDWLSKPVCHLNNTWA